MAWLASFQTRAAAYRDKGTRHWHSFPCVVDLVAAKTSRTEGIQLATKLENVVGAVIIQTSKLVFLLYIHPR